MWYLYYNRPKRGKMRELDDYMGPDGLIDFDAYYIDKATSEEEMDNYLRDEEVPDARTV